MALDRLDAIVRHYQAHHRSRSQAELASFHEDATDADAVRRAALAEFSGKRHPHQRRRSAATLETCANHLSDALPRLRGARDFDELYEIVEELIGVIPDIGPLTIYDTALRIGARFNIEPTKVYLHSGTLRGARALGLAKGSAKTLEPSALPRAFHRLSPGEIEDVLCIYEDELVHDMFPLPLSVPIKFSRKPPRGAIPNP